MFIDFADFSRNNYENFTELDHTLSSFCKLLNQNNGEIYNIKLVYSSNSSIYTNFNGEIKRNGNFIFDYHLEKFKEDYGDKFPFVGMNEKYIEYTIFGKATSQTQSPGMQSGDYCEYHWRNGTDYFWVKVKRETTFTGVVAGKVISFIYN